MKGWLPTISTWKHYRQKLTTLAVVSILMMFGVVSIGYGLSDPGGPPVPQASAAVPVGGSEYHAPLFRSEPEALRIPSIDVVAPLIQTGLNADGSPEIPYGEYVDTPSWMTTSVTPGEKGTAVLLGHVDSIRSGPSVFYNLGTLVPGNRVEVTRSDGSIAVFKVYKVTAYDRDNFPDQEVYGHKDFPALHLITCGGEWNPAAGEYSQNIVVFARLIAYRD